MNKLRNFVLRVSLAYIVLATIALLPGIQYDDYFFGLWLAAIVFVGLTGIIRPVLLALTLPFLIMTGGLFIFVIDGIILLLTSVVTTMEIGGVGWAILAGLVMSIMNIYVESAFKRFGWLDDGEDEYEEPPGIILRLILVVGLLFGLVFSVAMGLQMLLAISSITDSLGLLAAIGFVTFIMLLFAIATLVASGLHLERRIPFGILVTIAGAIGVAALSYEFVFTPLPLSEELPEPPTEVQYWDLDTGSRLAYTAYKSAEETINPPIVVLHGGPGWATLDEDRVFFQRLTDIGFDVYLYDQLGTGASPRPADMEGYTIVRAIADLDAIRETLDSPEMILIAQGAGSEIAARYMSQYPERVRETIFISPTPLTDDSSYFYDYLPTASVIGPLTLVEPRPIVASAMALYGPSAAQSLVSQEKMSALTPSTFNPGVLTCARYAEDAPTVEGVWFNQYANLLLDADLRQAPLDLDELTTNLTRVLIITTECDFVPWSVTVQYRDIFPNDVTFYLEGAGHMPHLTRPNMLEGIIDAFLLEERYPVTPYNSDVSPRPFIPQP